MNLHYPKSIFFVVGESSQVLFSYWVTRLEIMRDIGVYNQYQGKKGMNDINRSGVVCLLDLKRVTADKGDDTGNILASTGSSGNGTI